MFLFITSIKETGTHFSRVLNAKLSVNATQDTEALAWLSVLCVLMSLRAIPVGVYTPGRISHAGNLKE